MSHKEWSYIKSLPNDLEVFLIQTCKKGKYEKLVSNLYKCLQSLFRGSSPEIKEKWELEMNIIIEDQVWEQICENVHKITNSPTWKEFAWKVNLRYFRTPSTIFKIDNSKTNKCWRQCGQIGDHTHVFWDCPKLKIFWEGIRQEISMILYTYVDLDPMVLIFGVLPCDYLSKDKMYLFRILVLVAKKMITISWLKPLPPTVEQWKERLTKVYTMEKITACLNLTMDHFKRRWDPLKVHIGLT